MSDPLTHEGRSLPGYLAPASGARALVLIHEWWGVNAHIKGVADRFAKAGYTTFAVDLFDGKVATTEAEAEALRNGLDHKRALWAIGTAQEALAAQGKKVGVVGFCLGGALALSAAAAHPGFLACVPFYGIGQLSAGQVRSIRARVQGHFEQKDDWCTPAKVDALAADLTAAKGRFQFHRYGAGHAFFNETRPAYSEKDAALAFERTLGFLEETLA